MLTPYLDAPCLFTLCDGGRPWRTHEALSVWFDDAPTRGTASETDPSLTLVVETEHEIFRYPGWSKFEVADSRP